MPFYARPTELLSPGDIFPELPVGTVSYPLKVIRRSGWNPPPERGEQELWRAHSGPEIGQLQNPRLGSSEGESVIASARLVRAMLLSWGSQIEEDVRNFQKSGRAGGKCWLTAPIFPLSQIPETQRFQDRETGESVLMRDIIRNNQSHLYLYLPPFPESQDQIGHYLDFRKMTTLPIRFYIDAAPSRIVTLHEDGLNMLFSRIMWFLTRAEYFYHPITCQRCGSEVEIDLNFEGQNVDAEPWQ
jgi:hypothetical protein